MTDLAHLELRISSSEVPQAEQRLSELAATGGVVETVFGDVESVSRRAMASVDAFAVSASGASSGLRDAQASGAVVAAQIDETAAAADAAADSLTELGGAASVNLDFLANRSEVLIDTFDRVESGAAGVVGEVDKFAGATAGAASATKRFSSENDVAARSAKSLGSDVADLQRRVVGFIATLASLEAARRVVGSLLEVESGLVGVAKTAGLSGIELAQLEQRFKATSVELRTPITRLLELAGAAGQVGVTGVRDLTRFAETISEFERASQGIEGEAAVLSLSRLLALSGQGASEIDALTSSIVRLGNETSATEREIIETGTAVGASLATYRVAATTAAALGAALVQAGQDAEAGSSVLGITFSAIDQAVAQGGAQLQQFASIAGVSAEAFTAAFSADRVAAFQAFIEGLGRLTETQNITTVLESVGLEGIRTERILGALAANSEILGNSLAIVEDELRTNTARSEEFRRGVDTLSGSLDGFKAAAVAAIDEGLDNDTGLAGGLRAVVDTGTAAIQVLAGLVPPTEDVGVASRVTAAGLRLLAVGIGAVGVASLTRGFLAAKAAVLAAVTPLRLAVVGVTAVASVFGDLDDAVLAASVTFAALKLGPLVAGLTATGATAATTGIFMGGLAGATLRASLAFGALKAAALANPFTALLVGASALVPIISAFTSKTADAADAQGRLNEEADRFAPIVERLARAQAGLAAATASGDSNAALAALREQIRLSEELAREAELAQFGGERRVAVRLESFGAETVGQVVAELEAELLRRVDASDAPSEIASIIAERIGAGFSARQAPVLAGFDQLLTLAQQDALAAIELGGELTTTGRAAREVASALDVLAASGDPATQAEQYERIREALESVAASVAFTAPSEAVVAAAEQRITALEQRAAALRNAPGGPAFTEDELGAQARLDALEATLVVERELAAISDQGEVAIQRNLREAASLVELTGLSETERAARLASLEALLRDVDALERARTAREREAEARDAARASLDDFVAGLSAETAALSLSADERERAVAREEALTLARAAGIEDTDTLLGIVDAEIAARQALRRQLAEEEDARRSAAAATADQAQASARALNDLRTSAERQIGGLIGQFDQLDQAIVEQRAALGSGAGVAQARSALADYERQIAATVDALEARRDAEVAAAQSTDEAADAVQRFQADLAVAQGAAAGFADRLYELSQIRALSTLSTEAARLDEEFASLFRTDRENRIADSLQESERAAADLFAILESRRGLGLIDQTQFEEGARAIDDMVGSTREAAEELERLRTVRGVANDLAEGIGEVTRGLVSGTTDFADAAQALQNVAVDVAAETFIIDPLKEGLRAAFTEAGAALTGIAPGVALEAAAVTAGTSFSTAVATSTTIFTTGVATAGQGLIAAATTAASILAAQQAAGAATSAVSAVASGGASLAGSPAPSPTPIPVSLAESPFAVGGIGARRRAETQFAPSPSQLAGPIGGRTIRSGRAGGDIVFNVQTQNASSFEKSRAQIERDASRAQRRLGRR